MSFTVRWTRRALKRFDEIGAYIAKDNPEAAGRTVAVIAASIVKLGDHPLIGRSGRLAGTRELAVAGTSYIVAYRVRNTDVEILTVLHGARQWPDHL